jgi:hypothetical protein
MWCFGGWWREENTWWFFPTKKAQDARALGGGARQGQKIVRFSWEEKLIAPLIAAPNGEMRKWEYKGTEHKSCNCNANEITILFCKQIGQSPNTSYAKCRMGLREEKIEMAGNSFSSHPIFVS